MIDNYNIKNGQDVRKRIEEALSYYSKLYSAFFHILINECGWNFTQVSSKLKNYGFEISPRAVSCTMERFPCECQSESVGSTPTTHTCTQAKSQD